VCNETFESVWDAIEDTPAQAMNMRLRSSMMIALTEHMRRNSLTRDQAAKDFGVTTPVVTDLLRGKIDRLDLDQLVDMLANARIRVEIKIGPAR
jgi:predicted XRE-type DNA-binding protein